MLFYSPDDPPLMPQPAARALHLSQLAPPGVLALGTLIWIVAGAAGPWPWSVSVLILLFGAALSLSVAVPMWCGIRYDLKAASRTAGALRALGIWCWFQGFLLVLCLVVCGLILDACGVWPDRNLAPPAGPLGGPAGPLV